RLADQAGGQEVASGRGVDRDALVGEQLLQLAGLEHLADDIATADELALDVKLRNGRPVRIILNAVAELSRLQNVQAFVADADVVEDLHHLARESALGELRRALHKQHDVVGLHLVVDKLLDAHLRFLLGRPAATLPWPDRSGRSNPVTALYVS